MSYFFSQSVSQVKNRTGKKYTKFQIVKGHDGTINQIKGETNNGDLYHIQHDIKKKNDKTGMVHSQHKVYKIKSSDLQSILKESQKATKDNKKVIILKESPKKVISKKDKVTKVEKVEKVKKTKKPEKVKKTSTVKKAPKKVVKKDKRSNIKKVKKVKVKEVINEK